MAEVNLPRRLAPNDALFLYIEREEEPQTVGCVATFEGHIPLRKFMRTIDSRLHLIPRYRQKIVRPPLNVGLPTWEDDTEFNIENHLHEISLPKPGTDDQLREQAECIFEGMMDMSRPLWEIYLVKGMEGNRTGMIARVHHAMVDGVAGISLMYVLFDVEPNPPQIKKAPFNPKPAPPKSEQLYEALWDNAIQGVQHWTRFQKNLAQYALSRKAREVADSAKAFLGTFVDFLKPLDKLPFNRPFNGKRRFAFGEFSFAEARAIRTACGGTLNDVVLTTLGGAIHRYLEMHSQATAGVNLRVLVPVNIRLDEEHAELGNRITFLPVTIPLSWMHPVERLREVAETTAKLKKLRVSEGINLLLSAVQGAPPLLQNVAMGAANSPAGKRALGLLQQMPPANLICTNVPGPQIPLYTAGRRLIKYYPLLPVTLGMGISCGITSYDQRLCYTLMADEACAPDVQMLSRLFKESFEELRQAAAVKQRDYIEFGPNGRHAPQRKDAEAAEVPRAIEPVKPQPIAARG